MKFIDELREFLFAILKWLYFFLGALIFLFTFGAKEISLYGRKFFLPFLSQESFTVRVFERMVADLLPGGIEVVVTSPLEAFWAQMSIAFVLSLIITSPILIYQLLKYFLPALHGREKLVIFKVLIPSTVLFLIGCIFSYLVLIPATIEVLYVYYVRTIGVTSFFALKEFVPFVLSLTIGVGVVFMLPVLMVALSYLRIVDPVFWKNNWKYSLLIFLIVSAIITPDGSGITMLFLSVPLILLYSLGYLISNKIVK